MPADSNDARGIVEALNELRDAVLFHAAYTSNPALFKSVDARDESYLIHGIKTAFRTFKNRSI
jgi:hypothetical protein